MLRVLLGLKKNLPDIQGHQKLQLRQVDQPLRLAQLLLVLREDLLGPEHISRQLQDKVKLFAQHYS